MQERTEQQKVAEARPNTYTFGEVKGSPIEQQQALDLVILSHTKAEHQLYELMFAETRNAMSEAAAFSIRHLMVQTKLHSYSSIRRARGGLIEKMSIERREIPNGTHAPIVVYHVYNPLEIVARRQAVGFNTYPKGVFNESLEISVPGLAIERLIEKYNLSRREAQVAVRCSEGLTNAEIGEKLLIHEETVKFHLRNVFVKCGVKRRTELMNRLFRQEFISSPFNSN